MAENSYSLSLKSRSSDSLGLRLVVGKKKLLLIGGNGFVGRHVASQAVGCEVISTGRECDVSDQTGVAELIDWVKPDRVVHLAAITTLAESFENPRRAIDVNFGGVLNVLSALQHSNFNGDMLFVSSSEVYGPLPESALPIAEDWAWKPTSPYAVGKMAAEALCRQWSLNAAFRIIVARPFNHIGPGQGERFAISSFARRIAMIRLGQVEPVLEVGDIDTKRDFTDVRDVARAYLLLLEKGESGEVYNVCSGQDRSIRSLIVRMCEIAGVEAEIRTNPSRMRPNEQRRVCGDHSELTLATGWEPEIAIDRTLSDILEEWSTRCRKQH